MDAQADIRLDSIDVMADTDAGHSSVAHWIAKAQQAMAIVCVLASIALICSWAMGIFELISIEGLIKKEEKKISSRVATQNENASFAASLPDVALQNRSLFSWSSAPVAVNNPVSSPATTYRLVGISEGGSSTDTVAMVENTKTKMTLVLPMGKNVEGLELIGIQNGKATVKIGGMEIELE